MHISVAMIIYTTWCVCVCLYMHICMYMYVYECICFYMYVCVYICRDVFIYVGMCWYAYMCMYVYCRLTGLTRIKLASFTTRHECCCRSNTGFDVSYRQTGILMAMRGLAFAHVATLYLLPPTLPIATGHTSPPTTLGPGPSVRGASGRFSLLHLDWGWTSNGRLG